MLTLEQRVIEYQQTRCNDLFNELYEEVAPIINDRLKKHKDTPEICSRVNMAVFECFIDYDPNRNDNFAAYLSKYLYFAIGKAIRFMKQSNTKEFALDDYSMLPCEQIGFSEAENTNDLNLFLEAYDFSEEDKFIIKRLLEEKPKKEIANALKCSPANVTARIKRIRALFPELQDYLK